MSEPNRTKLAVAEQECAKCTLCSQIPSSGFFTGCMIRDIPPEAGINFGGWSCDGKGNLTRPLICWSCKKPIPLTEKLDLDLAELPNRGKPMCGPCRGQHCD